MLVSGKIESGECALIIVDGFKRIAHRRALKALGFFDSRENQHHRIPSAGTRIGITVTMLLAPQFQELVHRILGRTGRYGFRNLHAGSDIDEAFAQRFAGLFEHSTVIEAGHQQNIIKPKLFDVFGGRHSRATLPHLDDRTGTRGFDAVDLDAHIGIIGLVAFDHRHLDSEIGRNLDAQILHHIRIGGGIMNNADFADLCFFLEIAIAGFNLETGRRQYTESPFLLLGPLRQDRAEHHRNAGARDGTRSGKVTGRDATAVENLDIVI